MQGSEFRDRGLLTGGALIAKGGLRTLLEGLGMVNDNIPR